MGRIHTYAEIAGDYDLWMEFVEPHPALTREGFQAVGLDAKVQRQVELFGPEAARTLPEGLTAEAVRQALDGPREQRIRDLERLLSLLDGWDTAAAREVRSQVEDGLAELVG